MFKLNFYYTNIVYIKFFKYTNLILMQWIIIQFYKKFRKLVINTMEKKVYIPPRSAKEQEEIHIKILLGAIILTVIIFVFVVTNQ